MSRVVVDTSVLLKWFHTAGEDDLDAAMALRDAHVAGHIDCFVLDLGVYELGNVLVRSLRWSARDVADQLDDLVAIMGVPLAMSPAWMRDAANLAVKHKLTYYDAAWAAAARGIRAPLASADAALRRSGLGASATEVARQLGLLS